MSPLIDVTNTPGHEPLFEIQHMGSQRRRRLRLSRSCPRIPCSQGQGEVSTAQSHKSFERESEPVVIRMCNIQVSYQDNSNAHHQQFTANCQCSDPSNQSDAPLLSQATDILLSQAVQTLSLSQNCVQSGLQTQRHIVRHKKKHERTPENEHKAETKVAASCSGLPETPSTCESGSSTQQCGACGLEFTSLPVLTQHLARHVYDGLYAAQWLTQAMRLLVSRQPSDVPVSHEDRNSINDVLQNSSVG